MTGSISKSTNAAVVIPAKGTSARVVNKNLQKISGKSLVRIATMHAIEARIFDEVFVDTDSEEV